MLYACARLTPINSPASVGLKRSFPSRHLRVQFFIDSSLDCQTTMRKFGDSDEWDLGGVGSRLFGLDQPVRPGFLWVPSDVCIQGDRLTWTTRVPISEVQPANGFLDAFLSLHKQPDPAILRFAKKWGLLGVCDHDLPCSHNWPPNNYPERPTCMPRCEKRDLITWYWEPLSVWRGISKHMSTLLTITAQARQGKKGQREDWLILTSGTWRDPPPWEQTPAWALNYIQDKVNHWLMMGQVNPSIHFDEARKASLRLDSKGWPGLFGELSIRLMLAVTGVDGLPLCYECGRAFLPRKKPNPQRRMFCPQCGEKARSRATSRDYYERKKHAKTRK